MMSTVKVVGNVPEDPRERVLALSAAAEGLSRAVGGDPADAISSLLCAAVKIAMDTTSMSSDELASALASSLGHSIVAAGHWFAEERESAALN